MCTALPPLFRPSPPQRPPPLGRALGTLELQVLLQRHHGKVPALAEMRNAEKKIRGPRSCGGFIWSAGGPEQNFCVLCLCLCCMGVSVCVSACVFCIQTKIGPPPQRWLLLEGGLREKPMEPQLWKLWAPQLISDASGLVRTSSQS